MSVDANGETVERGGDAGRKLGFQVRVAVVVRQVREVRAVGTDLTPEQRIITTP